MLQDLGLESFVKTTGGKANPQAVNDLVKAKLGIDGKDEEIENFIMLMKNMKTIGLDTICYNWMPVIGWYRTDNAKPGRGGALMTAFAYNLELLPLGGWPSVEGRGFSNPQAYIDVDPSQLVIYTDEDGRRHSEWDLTAWQRIRLIIVATPDFWHAPHTIDCLKAGKHVYCEKEMSNTLEGARSMVMAQRETGKLLQIGHQRRSNPRSARRWRHCCISKRVSPTRAGTRSGSR